jgi:glycosyltransferase involved in cell wall biosynthesis
MPLRAAEWLVRRHPAVAAAWTFKQGPAGETIAEQLARQDEAFNLPSLQRNSNWSVQEAALCLGPLFGRGPLRPVIDAAAAGIAVAAPRTALTEELFHGTAVPLVSPANPLALGHAFLTWTARPSSWQRPAAELAPSFRERHDPARLQPKWERLLAATIARSG